jgi:hypothetical protein
LGCGRIVEVEEDAGEVCTEPVNRESEDWRVG